MARLAGTALVEIGLDVGFGQRQPRRATVDDRAERGTVAFPPSREAKNASAAVETHARAVLSMNSIRLLNGSSVKKRWWTSMMLASWVARPAASIRARSAPCAGKRVVSGKSVSVRVDPGVHRIIKQKKKKT